jgi:cell division protein FtsB
MPFSVDDFGDLLRLLEAHPEWRAELRRQVLTDELLSLPGQVAALGERTGRVEEHLAVLAEHMGRAEAQMATLAERMAQLTARVDALTERLDALTARVDALAADLQALARQVANLTSQMESLTRQVGALTTRVGDLEGDVLELRSARRAPAYLSRLARRLRVIEPGPLADLLDDAVDANQLTPAERDTILDADLVVSGRRREDQQDLYLVVEVSAGIGIGDVDRAARHARLLEKLSRPVIPVVAGRWIHPEA